MRKVVVAALLLTGAAAAPQGRDVWDIVRETPCLQATLDWVREGRPQADFVVPPGNTEEQCEQARVTSTSKWFIHELTLWMRAESEAAEVRARQLAREAQAKLPPPRIGMNSSAVIKSSRWGTPDRISRTTDASGVAETWFYVGRGSLVFKRGRLVAIHEY